MHENTFTRAKDSRLGITALGWSTEIRKDALKKVGKTVSQYSRHPYPMERDIQPMGEGGEVRT